MKNPIRKIEEKLEDPSFAYRTGLTLGTIAGCAGTFLAIRLGAVPHIIDLSKKGHAALVNDETLNGLTYATKDHAFKITLLY